MTTGILAHTLFVMPNHIHGIIIIHDGEAGSEPATTRKHSLSEIVRGFKTFSARRINEQRKSSGVPVWQRNYLSREIFHPNKLLPKDALSHGMNDHIIRNEKALLRIQEYILTNPQRWEVDSENSMRIGSGNNEAK
ncbi:MAG: hypothetical protein HY966_02970 [Ignavibacteriales bacterium]|nr:hypothetical protein [Ignavibacteriales bacterium]